MRPRVLIPTGYGLNCEDETAYAFTITGAKADKVHLSDVFTKPSILRDYEILTMIGGFSFGDHIAGGKVLANRYKHHLSAELQRFIGDDKLVIGICNGFQSMADYGLLPGFDGDYEDQSTSLAPNDSGIYEDRWVHLKANPHTRCIFTKGIGTIQLPIRHGEGKFTTKNPETLARLSRDGQIALRYVDPATGTPTQDYPFNPNGSVDAIAGISDPTGRVFGLMPHPEAYSTPYNHPNWTRQKLESELPEEGLGLLFFRNAVEYVQQHF